MIANEKGKLMLTKDSKVAVVGAGAIGGITAAFIHQFGWDTEIICKHQETVDKIAAQGLHICERGKEHGVPTPINDALRNMVLEIEDGKRVMSLNNLKDSVFAGI
jgi:ketopantoate reductase